MRLSVKKLACAAAVISLSAGLLAGCGSSSDTLYAGSSNSTSVMTEAAYDEFSEYARDYDDYEYDYVEEEYSDEGFSDDTEVEVTEGAKSERKLIRTVNLDIETYDFDAATGSIANRVASLGGYVESSSVDGNTSSYYRNASYTLRIPADKADTFIASIGESSNITHQTESMEDVTLQYVDINSRKESLKVEYSRLEELLAAAEDVEELIYIESRMSEVRYQIESIESQLRSYDNKVDYTTIYLYISEVREYTEPEPIDDSVGARISRGLSAAFENIGDFFKDLLVFIVVAIPYIIVIALLIVIVWLLITLIRRCARSYRAKHPKKMKAPAYPQSYMNGQNLYAQPQQPAQGDGSFEALDAGTQGLYEKSPTQPQ